MRIRIIVAIGCSLLFLSACSTLPGNLPLNRNSRQVYFVPLGDFPKQSIDKLTAHYQRKFDITIKKLPPISIDPTMVDSRRNQVVAESLIALIKREHPELESDPDAVVIGLTREDMYIHKYDWTFAFNLRQGDRFAVISVARMDPINFELPADESLLQARTQKMVTKNIGILYFRKPLNDNPRSVLYSRVDGLEELDAMSEEF